MTHGSLYGYGAGCRCKECKRAKSRAARKYHRRKMKRLDPTWTPNKWRAKHGTNAKYSTGCRCARCREAHRKYRLIQNRREGYRERVDAAPLRPLAECMAAFGLERQRIAAAAGCSVTTLRLKRETVIARTAERITELHWGLWRRHGPFRMHCRCEVPEEVLASLEAA